MKKKVLITSLICSLLVPTANLAIAQDASKFVFFHLGEKKDGSLDLNPNKRSFSIKKRGKLLLDDNYSCGKIDSKNSPTH